MTRSLDSHRPPEGLVMVIVSESVRSLKGFLEKTGLRASLLSCESTQGESLQGRFLFIVDASLVSQAGAKTQNT